MYLQQQEEARQLAEAKNRSTNPYNLTNVLSYRPNKTLETILIPSATEHIRYEMQRYNNTAKDILAEYHQNRSQAVLDDPTQYKVWIERFEMEGVNIPLWTGVDKNLEFTIVYAPDAITIVEPIAIPATLPIYNTETVVDYINEAFVNAYNQLVVAYDAIHGAGAWVANGSVGHEPFGLDYDPVTELFTFYASIQNESSDPNRVDLYFNHELYVLFAGNYYDPVYLVPNSHLILFLNGYGDLNHVTLPDSITYIQNQASFSTDEIWHDIKQVVITSTSLGMRPIQIGTVGQDGNPAYNDVLLDFDVVINNTVTSGPATRIVYIPYNYRITDMAKSSPLNFLQFQVFARTRTQRLIPLTIPSMRSMSLLCVFFKGTPAT